MTEAKKTAEPEQKQVSEEKKQAVREIAEKIKQHPVTGVVNLEGMPAKQLMQVKKQLRGQIELYMTRKKLIQRGIQEAAKQKKGAEKLLPEIKGIPALIFTKTNPFLLYKTIKKSKSPAPAKPGQLAPRDLVVQAGPTSFTPGPIIAELGSFGIKTMVENGKIVVRSDTVVAKENQIINNKLAGLLSKFGIEPMEVGLNITSMLEEGIVYPKNVLDIDEKEFLQKLETTARETHNIALEIGYTTKETIEPLIMKVRREARTLALEAKILADEVMGEILAQAEREMNALKDELKLPEAPAAKTEEHNKEEAKTETPKTEQKKEEKPKAEQKTPEKPKETSSEQNKISATNEKKEAPKPPETKIEEKKTETKSEKSKNEPKTPEPAEKQVQKTAEEAKSTQNINKSAEKLLKEAEEMKIHENLKPVQQPQKNPEQEKKEKEKKELEEVERLTQKLVRKGTLR